MDKPIRALLQSSSDCNRLLVIEKETGKALWEIDRPE